MTDSKSMLLDYLRMSHDALTSKLEGLSEYDVRRPHTPTGTNLLGLVKHCAGVESGYFGVTFGRPVSWGPGWLNGDLGDDDPQIDLWVPADETRAHVLDLYRRSWELTENTITELDLDSLGVVPWWPADRAAVTLHKVVLHVVSDLARHAGHADIIRESIDGVAGLRAPGNNLPHQDADRWREYRAKVEQAARDAKE
ncbi:DinB family protein [Actinocorallia lasiicapitis]